MKNNSRFNNYFAIGSVMVNGGSLNLKPGQVGLFADIATKDGAQAVDPKNIGSHKENLNFQVGLYAGEKHRGVKFKKEDIIDVKWIDPVEQQQAKVIVGFDGQDTDKTISFKPGETKQINLYIENPAFALIDGINSDCISLSFPVTAPGIEDSCGDTCASVDCKDLITQAVSDMQNWQVGTSLHLSDLVKIRQIMKCENSAPAPTTEDADFYCLELCDEGTEMALAKIQGQTGLTVSRKDRVGNTSVYQVLKTPADVAPTTYSDLASNMIPDCETCEDGYTLVEGGFQYTVDLEDEGADDKATVEGLANAVAGSGVKVAQNGGVGTYIVILESLLSAADRETFITANPTASLRADGEVTSYCKADAAVDYTWEKCGTCKVTKEKYRIILPDTDCGTDRLVELQKAYPSLTITKLTGEGCNHEYETEVYTNMVCDECNPDTYVSKAPEDFNMTKWKKVESAFDFGSCFCGIEFEGIPLNYFPSNCNADRIGSLNYATKIFVSVGQKLTGGFATGDLANLSEAPVTHVRRPFNGTGYGAEFMTKYMRTLHDVTGRPFNDFAEAELLGIPQPFQMNKQYRQVLVTYKSRFANNTGRNDVQEEVQDTYVLIDENPAIIDYFNLFNR
jgi:hypothetical protein